MDKKQKKRWRISDKDFFRLANKSREANLGKRELSDATLTSIDGDVALAIDERTEQRRRAGSAPKRKTAIWQWVREFRCENPDLTAEDAWENLSFGGDELTIGESRFELYIEDPYLYQQDLETGVSARIKFNTFKRHYFSQARRSPNN